MIELAAFAVIYLILVAIFWWKVKRAAAYWWNRDITEQMLPKPRHVHHTERILGIKRWKERHGHL